MINAKEDHGLKPVGVLMKAERWALFMTLLEKEKKKASVRLRELVEEDIARLQGIPADPKATMGYEEVKSNHIRIVKESDQLRKQIQKQSVYDPLKNLAARLGLDFDTFGNLDEIVPKLLKEWPKQEIGSLVPLSEHVHQFITLVELVREKKEIEAKLTEIRISGSKPSVKPDVSDKQILPG